MKSFLSTEWTGSALDTAMVKCAVLRDATPQGLAAFAGAGQAEQQLVSTLLGSTLLMRDMLVAGGPAAGNYGQAMQILTNIFKASTVLPNVPTPPAGGPWDDRNQTTMLRRLALGTALGHANTITYRWPPTPNDTIVDPAKRYLHYEKHYLQGDLDPQMEVLTAFELRWTTNADAVDSDIQWMRETMRNFRPENIARTDKWRYSESVHTDVACERIGLTHPFVATTPCPPGRCKPCTDRGLSSLRFVRSIMRMILQYLTPFRLSQMVTLHATRCPASAPATTGRSQRREACAARGRSSGG